MKLNNYSNLFFERLLNEFPDFENFYKILPYPENKPDSEDAYLLIDIPEKDIWISTHYDNITIGFGEEHTHFSFHDTYEEDFDSAVDFLKKLLVENVQ